MHDILDPRISPTMLGPVSMDAVRLARKACDALGRYGVPVAIFVDSGGDAYAYPAAYSTNRPLDEIVGIYTPGVGEAAIADDLRITAAARLAAIGILVGDPGAVSSA